MVLLVMALRLTEVVLFRLALPLIGQLQTLMIQVLQLRLMERFGHGAKIVMVLLVKMIKLTEAVLFK
jgi:hypothetical protein